MKNNTERDEYDFWEKKTIISYFLSVLVFWIHCSSFEQYGENLPVIIAAIRFFFKSAITAGAVPLFFIISSALFYRDYSDSNYIRKIKSRLFSLLVPYILWNTINMLFQIAVSYSAFSEYFIGREKFVFSFENILTGIFHYKYNIPFWFIFALFVFHLGAPLIWRIIRNIYLGIVVTAIIAILAAFDLGVPTPFFGNRICLAYYMIGAIIGVHGFTWFKGKLTSKGIWIFSLCLVSTWIYIFMTEYHFIKGNAAADVLFFTLQGLSIWKLYDTFKHKKSQGSLRSIRFGYMLYTLM